METTYYKDSFTGQMESVQ